MKVILPLMFLLILSACCGCPDDWQIDDLLFSKDELAHFQSFNEGDTLVYQSSHGETDSIIITAITKDHYNPEFNCGCFGTVRPGNFKNLVVKSRFENAERFGSGDHETHILSMGKFLAPKESDFVINFRSFHFSSTQLDSCFHTADTVIQGYWLNNYYRLDHTRLNGSDSLTTKTVIWTKQDGLVAYEDMRGHVFMKSGLD